MSQKTQAYIGKSGALGGANSWAGKEGLTGIFGGSGDPSKMIQMFRMLNCNPFCDEHKNDQSPFIQEL